MKEVTFKAKTEEELYKMAKAFCDGFLQNCLSYKAKFIQLNPIGKKIIRNWLGESTNLTACKKYKIVGVSYENDICVLNDKGEEKWYTSFLFDNVDYPDRDIYK